MEFDFVIESLEEVTPKHPDCSSKGVKSSPSMVVGEVVKSLKLFIFSFFGLIDIFDRIQNINLLFGAVTHLLSYYHFMRDYT